MVVNYGVSPYPTNYDLDRTIEGIITLKDRDGNISKGKCCNTISSWYYYTF